MPSKDFYAILGVPKTASDDEIKKAFRRLAHEHHPDKGGDQQKFKDINEAYQVLGDKEKRGKYDQFGSAAFEQGGFGGGQGFGGFSGFSGNVDLNDLGDLGEMFGEMFGFQGGRGSKQQRGANVEVDVNIDFLDAVKGVTTKIKLHKNEQCSVCTGSGAEPGSEMETCATCKGAGQINRSVRTMFGTIQSAAQCPECFGKGKRPKHLCKHCKGTGVERKTVELDIPIPAGINESEAIRITGGGEFPGVGGKAGDLFVRVHIKSHPLFSRDEQTILSTVEVPYSTLLLGGEIDIDTIDGKGSLKIPENTQPNTVFKLRGKGIPYLQRSGQGDHLVTVIAQVSKRLSGEQRRALEELRKAGL